MNVELVLAQHHHVDVAVVADVMADGEFDGVPAACATDGPINTSDDAIAAAPVKIASTRASTLLVPQPSTGALPGRAWS